MSTFKEWKQDNPNKRYGTYLKESGKDQKMSSIFGTVGHLTSSISSNLGSYNSTQSSLNQGLHSALQSAGPWGTLVSGVTGTVDTAMNAFGLGFNKVDDTIADRAGATAANKANEILAAIPGSQIWGALGKTLKTGPENRYENVTSLGNDDYAEGRVLFGGKKLQAWNDKVSNWTSTRNIIGDTAKLALNNDAGQLYLQQNQNRYAGYRPTALLSKNGMKIPALEEATKLLKLWSTNSNQSTPKKFQLGGKMNLIPEGALHARKHEITDIDPNLEGQITTKGIPVVSKSEGGVVQQAEIEREEWTLRKEFTDKLENLYKQYQKEPSNEIAIAAGRLICYELLNNTDDRSGLIKSIK